MASAYGMEPQAVPTTFIADRVWVGFNEVIKSDMEAVVQHCIAYDCVDMGRGIRFKSGVTFTISISTNRASIKDCAE
jgi:hypothetical protein